MRFCSPHTFIYEEKRSAQEKTDSQCHDLAAVTMSFVHHELSVDGLKDRNRKMQGEWKESVTY